LKANRPVPIAEMAVARNDSPPTLELDSPAPGPADDGRKPSGRTRLGAILTKNGVITKTQLAHALAVQPQMAQPIGRVLLKLNYVTDTALRQALSEQLGIPFVDLDTVVIDRALARVINKSYAKRNALLPLARIGTTLTVAMDDPTDQAVIGELRYLTRCSIAVVTATAQAISRAFARLYDEMPEASESLAAEFVTPLEGPAELAPVFVDEQQARRADGLLRSLLFHAIEMKASDLHLEMLQGDLRVRFRIDGVLRQPQLAAIQPAITRNMRELVSRIKILARLDIAERRRPQDGSFQVSVERAGQKIRIDLRVSVVPSYTGESVVIRLLDRSAAPRGLDDLDLSPRVAAALGEALKRTTGILLVTGPTGSGKSTTLSACLSHLQRPEIRILTAEDPVEYVYDELSQSEINPAIGNTFATYLRAFLRHDPEVIMVGEIRDQETAEMAFRAAQTGHLLISTMHTTSAITALPRLMDFRIEPSLIASGLVGVLSQRLVRKLCPACRTKTSSPARADELFQPVPKGFVFYAGRGCDACAFTGYKGRTLIADLWIPDREDFALITRQATFSEIETSARRTTVRMAEDAHARLRAGQTTVEELLRVLPAEAVVEHRERFSGKN
jgi:type IV pilus assembly protein PilB